MKKNKKVKNLGIQEASDFYDDHNIFETGDAKEVSDLRFKLHRRKYVGVDLALYSKIADLAKRVHTTAENLITMWLKQRLPRRA